MAPYNDFLGNLAIVALTTSAWTFTQRHLPEEFKKLRLVAFGSLMSVGTTAVMMLPFQFSQGIYVDLRYSFLAVSGLFGGPVSAMICLATAILLRVSMGGIGLWVGLPIILLASISGLVAFKATKRQVPEARHILLLSAAAAASGTVGFFLKIPVAQWPEVMPTVVGPFALVIFISTAIACTALVQEMRRQLVTQENRTYRAIIEALPDCLNAKDLAGRFIAANPATAELMGAGSVDGLIGKTDFDFYAESHAAAFRVDERRMMEKGEPLIVEQKFRRADGREAWLLTLKSPLHNEKRELIGLITHNREITEQKLLEQQLARAQAMLSDAVSSMADGIAIFDEHGVQLFHNQRYLDLFPLTADVRTDGNCLRSIIRTAIERGEVQPANNSMDDYVEQRANALLLDGDRQVKLADGRWIEARTRMTSESGYLIVFSDITKSKGTQEELELIARTDGLTGILNRRAFDEEVVRLTEDSSTAPSLLLLDIDHFKKFNDAYGHQAGDDCLKKVTSCLAEITSSYSGHVLARYGGEEFAIVLPMCSLMTAEALGNVILDRIRELDIRHERSPKGRVTVSIGIASPEDEAAIAQTLVRQADEALYLAKANGRDCTATWHEISPVKDLRAAGRLA